MLYGVISVSTILETVRCDGNVILVVDTAGRVLELMQLLEQLWRNADSGLSAYRYVFKQHFLFTGLFLSRTFCLQVCF